MIATYALRMAYDFVRGPQRPGSLLQYTTRLERFRRTLLTIGFFYLILNGSALSIGGASRYAAVWLWHNATGFWMFIGYAMLAAVLIALSAYMERRWALTKSQANLRILSAWTFAVTLLLGVVIAIIGRYFDFTFWDYWSAFLWTWQIPAGFFVGMGLSWSIRDRQLAGVVAVDQRAVDHDVTVRTQPIDDHHQHPTTQ